MIRNQANTSLGKRYASWHRGVFYLSTLYIEYVLISLVSKKIESFIIIDYSIVYVGLVGMCTSFEAFSKHQ